MNGTSPFSSSVNFRPFWKTENQTQTESPITQTLVSIVNGKVHDNINRQTETAWLCFQSLQLKTFVLKQDDNAFFFYIVDTNLEKLSNERVCTVKRKTNRISSKLSIRGVKVWACFGATGPIRFLLQKLSRQWTPLEIMVFTAKCEAICHS